MSEATVDAVPRPPHMPPARFDRLRASAVELEGAFLNTLVGEMFASLPSDGPFGGGFAEETWRSMMAEEYAGAFADAGGIGLADSILRELVATQSALTDPDPQFAAGAYAR